MTVYIGGDNRLPSLAFCQRFNRDAHYGNVKDSAGLERWVSQKQMYVYGIVSRIVLGDGKATMLAIAGEAGCHPTTVSRALLKFQAWGLFAVDVKRGRNGGIRIMRPFGEWAKAYIRAARQRLRELADRARINVASRLQRQEKGDQETVELPISTHRTMDATFSRKEPTFSQKVMYERALLALEDPQGEAEAHITWTETRS